MYEIYAIYKRFIKSFISSIFCCFKEKEQSIFIQNKTTLFTPMNKLLDYSKEYLSYIAIYFDIRINADCKKRQIENLSEESPKKKKSEDSYETDSSSNSSNEWLDTIYLVNSSKSNDKIKNIPTLNLYSEIHNSIQHVDKKNLISQFSNLGSQNKFIYSPNESKNVSSSNEYLQRNSPTTVYNSNTPLFSCGYCGSYLDNKNPLYRAHDKTFCSDYCRRNFSTKLPNKNR